MANELSSLVDEHIALLAEARRERNGYKRQVDDFAAALTAEQLLNAELVAALEGALEVMQFAYMNAPKQPKEIAQARAVLEKAQSQ